MDDGRQRRIENLRARHRILRAVRKFFDDRQYTEVDTPTLTRCPAIDAHIDAVEAGGDRFLITSPEIKMKILLVEGFTCIYQIGHAYRAGESGPWHNPEFTLLEWYRAPAGYLDLMDETTDLVVSLAPFTNLELKAPFGRIAVGDIFLKEAGWNPAAQWDEDRFFRDLVERIEPGLRGENAVFLYDYPAPVSGMAKNKEHDPRICERFELYLRGIEIANGYTELRDADLQRRRFMEENVRRRRMNKPAYPVDENFLEALRRGLPPCAGIALGVDRLVSCLLDEKGIGPVVAFKEDAI
jgi:lysyl-tRNA synthetase class 2